MHFIAQVSGDLNFAVVKGCKIVAAFENKEKAEAWTKGQNALEGKGLFQAIQIDEDAE